MPVVIVLKLWKMIAIFTNILDTATKKQIIVLPTAIVQMVGAIYLHSAVLNGANIYLTVMALKAVFLKIQET